MTDTCRFLFRPIAIPPGRAPHFTEGALRLKVKSPATAPESGPAASAGISELQCLSSIQLRKRVLKQQGWDLGRRRRHKPARQRFAPGIACHYPLVCAPVRVPRFACMPGSPALGGRSEGPAHPIRVVGEAGQQRSVLPIPGGQEGGGGPARPAIWRRSNLPGALLCRGRTRGPETTITRRLSAGTKLGRQLPA